MYKKISITFLFATILFLNSCSKKEDFITPEVKDITESVYASGIIKSKNQYEVYAKINGIVDIKFVDEGSKVEVGSPIVKIYNESSKYSARNAELNSYYSDYKFNLDKVEESEKALNLAHQKLEQDSLLYLRQQQLWVNSATSKIEFEKAELSYQSSKVSFTNAQVKLRDLKNQLKLLSEQSKNNFLSAKKIEDDFVVQSQLNGIVYKIYKEKGELVNNLTPLAIIGESDFELLLYVDEYDISKVTIGQKVFIKMDSYKKQVFEAEVTKIDLLMNQKTRSFEVTAKFKTRPKTLYPFLTAETNILIQTKNNALVIPREYLLNDSTVMLKQGNKQKIKTGLMDYQYCEVLSGITKNSKIIKPKK